jgi:hypothetical protein
MLLSKLRGVIHLPVPNMVYPWSVGEGKASLAPVLSTRYRIADLFPAQEGVYVGFREANA